uniref:DUF2213 domain-containing protein n=1 Tax=viral metagenome TaxID=1070528 RepID=A0A6M3J6R9_9ZZZZ
MALRLDAVGSLGRAERTPAGGLRVPAVVAREGVLTYPWGREYVPPATLEASLAQLNGLPVTLTHPSERRVDSQNWRRTSAGHAGEDARMDGDTQGVTLYVQRDDAVAAVEKGTHRQLSMGYDTDLDPTPGVSPSGERYDAVQIARTYNHIALVRQARGGSSLAIRLDDAGDAVFDEPAGAGKGSTMKRKIRIDGVDYEVEAPESFFQALDLADGRRADELKAATACADSTAGERDALKGQLDETKKRLDDATDPARLDERVKARAELEASARKVLGSKTDFSGKTDRQIMEATIRTDAAQDLSARSDDYIRGAFEARVSAPDPVREDGLDRVHRTVTAPRQDDRPSPLRAAIVRLRQDQAEAATRPIGGVR